MNYGVTDALAPFPLHSLVNVMSATINNNTVSFNVQETLPLLLRMVDPEELAKYDCMTPTALDYLADYDDAVYPMEWFLKPAGGATPLLIRLFMWPGQTLMKNQTTPVTDTTATANSPGSPTPITS
jgi:hypothetical protein